MARELATREHTDPFGRQVRLSRGTIDRWTCHYRGGGFAGRPVAGRAASRPRCSRRRHPAASSL
ncbi:helix-turn-helix domain-containing protein [Streptomyces sp. NPDC057291]|uniref:helix-turn-helix domain-containing protein n=1 Tax=Streptomyces sp. NPDC057291 TaxID=3346087 RepID=UPI00363C07EF